MQVHPQELAVERYIGQLCRIYRVLPSGQMGFITALRSVKQASCGYEDCNMPVLLESTLCLLQLRKEI